MVKQIVLPIKDRNVLREVQDTLKHNFKYGERNYTIFQVGKATLLRVSDVLRLKYVDVYDAEGNVKQHAYIHDKKTGKPNYLYLKPVVNDLKHYQQWLKEHCINSEWLFPSFSFYQYTIQYFNRDTHHCDNHYGREYTNHVTERQFYKVMHKVGNLLNINYLGTHTMRKTGAFMVYEQTNHNIALVMKLLNHSSEKMTLAYLGLDQETTEQILDTIHFD